MAVGVAGGVFDVALLQGVNISHINVVMKNTMMGTVKVQLREVFISFLFFFDDFSSVVPPVQHGQTLTLNTEQEAQKQQAI